MTVVVVLISRLKSRRVWLDVSTQAWTSQAWNATVGYETFTNCRLYCEDREKKVGHELTCWQSDKHTKKETLLKTSTSLRYAIHRWKTMPLTLYTHGFTSLHSMSSVLFCIYLLFLSLLLILSVNKGCYYCGHACTVSQNSKTPEIKINAKL